MAKTFLDMMNSLRKLFTKFRKHHLNLNPEKCSLAQREIRFLGRVLDREGIKAAPEKIDGLLNMAVPKTKKQLLSFIGGASWLRDFIPNFSEKALGLYGPLKIAKGKAFTMTDEAIASFESVKEALTRPEALFYPRGDLEFTLITDCSKLCAGAMLCQLMEDKVRPICYGSKVLNVHQVNYAVWRKELFALKTLILKYRHYLIGAHFTAIVDAKSITYKLETLLSKSNCETVLRWFLVISHYDFAVLYKEGSGPFMSMADALSRNPATNDELYAYFVEKMTKSGNLANKDIIAVIREDHFGGEYGICRRGNL